MVLCGSLQCQVSSYLVVYPCFTLISVFCTMSFMITLPGASGFKAQMVAPCIWCQDHGFSHPKGYFEFLEVSLCSWRLLCHPRYHLCLFSWRSLAWAWSQRVADYGLVLSRTLAQAWSHGDSCLASVLAEFAGFGQVLWSSLVWISPQVLGILLYLLF